MSKVMRLAIISPNFIRSTCYYTRICTTWEDEGNLSHMYVCCFYMRIAICHVHEHKMLRGGKKMHGLTLDSGCVLVHSKISRTSSWLREEFFTRCDTSSAIQFSKDAKSRGQLGKWPARPVKMCKSSTDDLQKKSSYNLPLLSCQYVTS